MCFIYIGNSNLPVDVWVKKYATVGSLTRDFERFHVEKLQPGKRIDCRICDIEIEHRTHLLNHAELTHGTVTKDPLLISTIGEMGE